MCITQGTVNEKEISRIFLNSVIYYLLSVFAMEGKREYG